MTTNHIGTPARAPLTPGAVVPFDIPGTLIRMYLRMTDSGQTYTITTECGAPGHPDFEPWCATFPVDVWPEEDVRLVARHAARLLHRYGSPAAIEARRRMLVHGVNFRCTPDGVHANADDVAAMAAELDRLIVPADLASEPILIRFIR